MESVERRDSYGFDQFEFSGYVTFYKTSLRVSYLKVHSLTHLEMIHMHAMLCGLSLSKSYNKDED